jgi:hypothetical protein
MPKPGKPWMQWPLTVLMAAWAAPLTVAGLLLALVLYAAAGGRGRWFVRWPAVALVNKPAQRLLGASGINFSAMCIGQVIIARDVRHLAHAWTHECVHVRQAMHLGPLFPLLYLGSSVACWLRGQRPYWDNHFEREARAAERPHRGAQGMRV